MVQYSNSAKTCHQSEIDVTILKQCKNLSPARKRCKILNQGQNLSKVKKRWCNFQTEQTCHQSEKDGTILKQGQNLSPVRKRWYNTQTGPKSVTSQKKMVQYSNSAKSCHQSEMDGTIVKQSNLPTVRKKKRGVKRATRQRIQQKLSSNKTLSPVKK